MTQDIIVNRTGIKVVGVNQVETEQKRRRRRRRRRANNNISTTNSDSNLCCVTFDDDSSTCATVVSLSSDDSSTTSTSMTTTACVSSPQVLHYKNQQQQQQQQQQHKKKNQSFRKKRQQIEEEVLSVEEKARYLALDCEMVGVDQGGTRSSVARVTLVDWDGRIILDEFVRQEEVVTDYRTFVSGITQFDLENDTVTTFDDCRQKVQALIANKILVGHALKNDLRALHISHPWHTTRDTAKYDPFMQTRFVDDQVRWPRKLKELAFEHLKQQIQQDGEPHSSYEDAVAAMDLYRMVRRKWEKVMDYKIRKTKEIEYNKSFPKFP